MAAWTFGGIAFLLGQALALSPIVAFTLSAQMSTQGKKPVTSQRSFDYSFDLAELLKRSQGPPESRGPYFRNHCSSQTELHFCFLETAELCPTSGTYTHAGPSSRNADGTLGPVHFPPHS